MLNSARCDLPDIHGSSLFAVDPPELVLVDTYEHGLGAFRQLGRDLFGGDVAAHGGLDEGLRFGSGILFRRA